MSLYGRLFGRSLAIALQPAQLVALLVALTLAGALRGEPGAFDDGRDLGNVRLAWFGWVAAWVALGLGALRVGHRWRERDRHWIGSRLTTPAAWFRSAFGAQAIALGVGMALVVATLAHGSRATRPAAERVATRSVERVALSATETGTTLRFEPLQRGSLMRLPLHAVVGTGSQPRVRLKLASGSEATFLVNGRRTVEFELPADTAEIELERVEGTALLLVAPSALEFFAPVDSTWRIYLWLFVALWIGSFLPLGLGFALAARLHPALSLGLVAGSAALASTTGGEPFARLVEAIHLFEWNAFDSQLVLAEWPRALVGLGLGLFAIPNHRSDLAQGGSA